MTDDFKTIRAIVDRVSRSAVWEGFSSLRFGDGLKFRIAAVPGLDVSAAELWLWVKTPGQTSADALAFANNFAVDASTGDAYCTVSLTSNNLSNALSACAPGTPATFRLVVQEGTMPVLDVDVDVYPNPAASQTSPDPDDPYVRGSQFAGLSAVAARPVTNSAQLEEKVDALIGYLRNLAP